MLRKIKRERNLTVLLTTHYMDEADRLCDRIAIVGHGELKALDSPLQLKAAAPSSNTLDASFDNAPPDWPERLARLPGVDHVSAFGQVFRIASRSGPATTSALMNEAERAGVVVASLAVQSTSLDDVFVHYTGRDLRDALQAPSVADRHVIFRR
jgi:ABC-2 type transport system ATP-binding protein